MTYSGYAQGRTPSYPFLLAHNISTTPFYNPAYYNEHRADFQVHNFNFTGAFSEIRTTVFQSSIRIFKNERSQQHYLGFYAMNEREGPPISRQRLYLHYRVTLPLNLDWKLGAGANLGTAGMAVNGSSVNSTGTAYAPDGSVGLWLAHNQLELGLALQQLFQGQFRPIEETFELPRHMMSHVFWHQNFGALRATPFLRVRWRMDQIDVDSGFRLVYANTGIIGMDLRWNEALTFQLGLKEIALGQWFFRTDVLYYVALQQATNTRNNGFEVQLGIRLPEKKGTNTGSDIASF